ncbi:hypothetical protein [Maricaulis sp.]|uniref:hypothetical protein n=1 Tax=Maricaulis sp. TaxID=1486257 RepID=UPI00263250F1|nr:hypothetical protein [Maricaulis sp.]
MRATLFTLCAMNFDLDGHIMHAPITGANGVVNSETIFRFCQEGDVVRASYAGGKVRFGELIGRLEGDALEFRYCQIDTEGRLDGGVSKCSIETRADGALRIIVRFHREACGTRGINIIEDAPEGWQE